MNAEIVNHTFNALTGLGPTYVNAMDTIDSVVSLLKGLEAAYSYLNAFQTLSTHLDRVISENVTSGDALAATSVLAEFY